MGKKEKMGVKNVSEDIMAENFPKLKRETEIQMYESRRILHKMNSDPHKDIF